MLLVGKKKITIGPKLASVTTYCIGFVVKLLWKCCESLLLFLLKPNFCNSQVRVFNIFIWMITINYFSIQFFFFLTSIYIYTFFFFFDCLTCGATIVWPEDPKWYYLGSMLWWEDTYPTLGYSFDVIPTNCVWY